MIADLFAPKPVGGLSFFALLVVSMMPSGCVTVYQPLVGLQRPTVIDVNAANFEGVRMLVRCFPSAGFSSADAERVCGKVRRLFANQGAQIMTASMDAGTEATDAAKDSLQQYDFLLELRSCVVHEKEVSLLDRVLLPLQSEVTVAQEWTCRDAEGSLLASDTLKARFVEKFGVGVWGVNALGDLFVRSKEEQLAGDEVIATDFSRDLYQQLSQMVFAARMRSNMLHRFQGPPRLATQVDLPKE